MALRSCIVLFALIGFSGAIAVAECSLSRKRIQYRVKTCGGIGGCTILTDTIAGVGNKLVVFDVDPSAGFVYELGRTLNYTEKDVPGARQAIAENSNFQTARLSASASYSDGMLQLIKTETYYGHGERPDMTSRSTTNIKIGDACSTCKVLEHRTTINDLVQTDRKLSYGMVEHLSCFITDAQ